MDLEDTRHIRSRLFLSFISSTAKGAGKDGTPLMGTTAHSFWTDQMATIISSER